MPANLPFDPAHCIEDCPRCDRCPHTSPRRQRMEGVIRQYELERLRYETDCLPLPPLTAGEWHALAQRALAV
jgi:hypothetical protein